VQPKHQQTHRYTQLNLNQHRISPLQPRNIKNPLFSISSNRPPSPTIMVHVFQTTSLFAVLLVIAMTQGLSVLSSPLTGPTPPGPPREGEGGKGGEHNPPRRRRHSIGKTWTDAFVYTPHAPSETISRQSTASRNLIRDP
ncbi:hypothetical protein PSHT_13149, partial [Puccinia striiformis]